MQSTHAERTTADEETDGETVIPASVAVPDDVSSPRGKLVYLYLATHGAVTEDELCDGLGMKRITLYSVLGTLREEGIVGRDDRRYVLN